MPSVTKKQIQDGEEGKKRFMDKCFHVLKQEGKPQEQRVAQCLSLWKEAVKKYRAQGILDDPEWEKEFESGPFIFLP